MKIKDVISEAGFLNKLGAGIRGAINGVQASQAQRAADPDASTRNRIRQQNFKQELPQWQNYLNKIAKQVSNIKDPATFLKVLQSYVEVCYPNARVSLDINQVSPTNPKSISDYLFAAYNSEMNSDTTIAPTATTDQSVAPPVADVTPPEGQVLLVKASNGQEYFKAYTGQWFNKPSTDPANMFKAINPIKEPKDLAALNNQVSKGKMVPVKPTDVQHPNDWSVDQRRLKLANKSPAGKR